MPDRFLLTSSRTAPIMPNQTAAPPKTSVGALPATAQLNGFGTASAVSKATATPCRRLNASAVRSRLTSRT